MCSFHTLLQARLGTALGSTSPSQQTELEDTSWQEPAAMKLQQPKDGCSVDWSGLERDPKKGVAAVYTPYNVRAGGSQWWW